MPRLYHENPYLTNSKSPISGAFEEDGKYFLAVENNLFYPQGGGQKGDRGRIMVGDRELIVIDTIKDHMSSDGRPLCVLESPAEEVPKGADATLLLDWDHRFKQMRLHSVVHLHHCLMEKIVGRSLKTPSTSDINDDGTAYNRYESEEITEALANEATSAMAALIEAGADIVTRDDPVKEGFRYWETLGFVIPCGGTHLKNLNEIGGVVGTFSKKKGRPKIAFQLTT